MRLLIDTVVALMLVALLGGAVWYKREHHDSQQVREHARAELRRFQQQVSLQAALATVQRNEHGFPSTIEAEWFMGNIPANPLLNETHPWVEIAGPEQRDLEHPLQRVAVSSTIAKFWYNPYTGLVRARVAPGISDAAVLEVYNFVNDCHLPELFAK